MLKNAERKIRPQAISRHSTRAPSGLRTSGIIRRQSQNLTTVVSDGDSMFKMRRKTSVGRNDRPAVFENTRLLARLRHGNHRLDGERHTGLQDKFRSGLSIIRNLGIFMDRTPNAMADPVADDAETRVLGHLLDRVADIAEMNPGAARSDTRLEAGLGRLHQSQYLRIGDADGNRTGSITIEAVLEDPDIGLYEVARHYDAMTARDAVNDLVVDRNAKSTREAHVIEKTGANLVLRAILLDQIVNVARSDSGSDGVRADVANLGGHPARFTHAVDFGFGFDVDFHK